MAIAYTVRYILFLIFLIPSVLCSFFVLYHLLVNRVLRKALNNHFVILIHILGLIFELTDIIWLTDYYRTGHTTYSTSSFCLTWVFVDFAIYSMISWLVAWGSIERHFLIFHQNWVATQKQRILIHYIPLFTLCIYFFIFFVVVLFGLPCENNFDYTRRLCGYNACFYNNPIVGVWDSIVHNVLPVFIIVIFSLALLIRVFVKKYQLNQRIQWRNYRKMTIQLLSITAIYFVVLFPLMIMYAAYTFGLSTNVGSDYYSSGIYFAYYTVLLTPFVSLMALHELRSKCRDIIFFYRPTRAVVGPEIIVMTRRTAP